jgi:hypothetical protein
MSYNFFIDNVKTVIQNITELKQSNSIHELEFRFGSFSKTFNSDVGMDIFKKFFQKYMDGSYENKIIVDKLYNFITKKKFFKDGKFNVRNNFILKETYENNFNTITTDFTLPNEETIPSTVEYIFKEKREQYTKDNLRFNHNLEHNVDIYKNSNYDILHEDNRPYDTFRLKNRYTKKMDLFQIDLTIVKTIDAKSMKQIKDVEYIVEVEIIELNSEYLLNELNNLLKEMLNLYTILEQ